MLALDSGSLFLELGYLFVLAIVYVVAAFVIAGNAKKRGFHWRTYFWINLLLGVIGWVISIFLWRTDLRRNESR